jgi:predicted flap endonuclease-1-like 5' DNA nuclease
MLMLTIETFLLLLLAGLLGLAVGHLIACGRSGGGVDWSDDEPWLRDGRAVPAAPVLPAAPTLLAADERARLAATLAEAKGAGETAAAAPATASTGSAGDAVAKSAAAEAAAAAASAAAPASSASPAYELPAEVAAAAVTPTVAPEDVERAAAADAVGTRPMAIAAPLAGKADKLTLIKGVGPQNEKKLHGLGVYHFAQIAAWTPENATWAGSFMAFPGRIEREDWIGQAKLLATGAPATGTSAASSAADEEAAKAAAEAAAAKAEAEKVAAEKAAAEAAAAKAEAEKAAAEKAAAEAAAAKAEAEKAAAEKAAAEAAAAKAEAEKVAAEKAAAEKAAAEAASAQGASAAYALPAEMAAAAVAPTVAPEDAERAAAADAVGTRPLALAAPVGGKADDLKRIRGIGPANEKKLHGLGVYHFSQIAAWTEENAKWAGSFMAFPGRIEREEWIPQAKILATGAETAFSKRVDAGEVPTSQ